MLPKSQPNTTGLLLTLDRGIRVLEAIADGGGRASAKELSLGLAINLGTMYQLLRTLESNGYIVRLPGGTFRLGTRIGFLIDRFDLETAPPKQLIDKLHELRDVTEETVYISMAQGTDITVVASLEGTQRLRVGNSTVGYTDHPHARASGKAFLSACEPDEVDRYLRGRELTALTSNTITNRDTLTEELKQARRQGVAYDREEFEQGIVCIGAAIIGADGKPVGSYTVALPSGRFPVSQDSITADLLAASEASSVSLGYDGPYPPPEGDA